MNNRMRIREQLLVLMAWFMPFHSFFFAVTNLQLLVLWRDALILGLFFLAYLSAGCKIHVGKRYTEGYLVGFAILACTLYAVLNHSDSASLSIWVNTLRIYIGTFFVYFIGCWTQISDRCERLIKRGFVFTAAISGVWGIFQMFVLGPDFLNAIGYGTTSAVLADGFQRNVGVFSSANLMGVFTAFAILMLVYGDVDIKGRLLVLLFLCLSLLLTFSTSAIIGLLCVIAYRELFSAESRLSRKAIYRILIILAGAVGLVFLIWCVDALMLNNVIYERVSERVTEMVSALQSTSIGKRMTSASIHMDDLNRAAEIFSRHPEGIGFSGPTFMLLGRMERKELIYAVESSLFTILFDYGLVVGIIYLLPFIYPILAGLSRRTPRRKTVANLMPVVLLVLYVFLPLVSSIELRFFYFLFLGMEHNRFKMAEPQ